MFQNSRVRLGVLTFIHFTVDFYGGLPIPLPEPTLIHHLHTDLGTIALLVGGCAFLVNIIQPISGWLMPPKGVPIILLLAPLAAGLNSCIGLTHSFGLVLALILTASLHIGLLHPEGALAAHSLSGRHHGLGMSIFMAGGYLGFAGGGLASGIWVEFRNQGLNHFWLLSGVGIVAAGLAFLSGLHRLEGHVEEEARATRPGELPVWPVLALCALIATHICMLVRFITIYLVRAFPNADGQGWGGAAVFATGAFGGIAAFIWGHFSDRFGRARLIGLMQLAATPFLFLLFHTDSPSMAPVWAIGIGLTMGGVFPLSVVLARQSRGLPPRLRMGLAIGGAWGIGELLFITVGKFYVDRFPAGAPEPVMNVLNGCWLMLAATAVLAAYVARMEKKATNVNGHHKPQMDTQ